MVRFGVRFEVYIMIGYIVDIYIVGIRDVFKRLVFFKDFKF